MKYQGKTVTARDARPGDNGYDASKEQSVIKFEDGTEKTVLRSEVVKD